ncbi:MAG: virulence RhuM family protein [Bacteroidales bacterium]|nr:virulence RhuM family protein [Bacteroidales bacterium]
MPIGNNSEIIIYQPDADVKLEVRLNGETVWLNRQQMAVLFDRDVKTIGKHVNNALAEELKGFATVAKFATVQQEGNRLVTRDTEYYNLDVILSVGYRVKSQRGILFRQWANRVLKDYLLKGHAVNRRFEQLEYRMTEAENKIDFFVRTALPPVEGIFYDGQIFDAYTFVSDLVRSAKERIVLFDNYVDDTVLTMLDKRGENVSAIIITKAVSSKLELDLAKHNAQYRPIEVMEFDKVHDRFLCIDSTVYHIGASLKDLGKKWFAFSRMEVKAEELLMACKTL